jgi:hypothetical protein
MKTDRQKPHTHGTAVDDKGIRKDSLNGMYGSFGIFRLEPVQPNGVQIGHSEEPLGVHSGRFYVPDGHGHRGPFQMTKGCIRTSNRAMQEIKKVVASDHLTSVVVRNNGSIGNATNPNATEKK